MHANTMYIIIIMPMPHIINIIYTFNLITSITTVPTDTHVSSAIDVWPTHPIDFAHDLHVVGYLCCIYGEKAYVAAILRICPYNSPIILIRRSVILGYIPEMAIIILFETYRTDESSK